MPMPTLIDTVNAEIKSLEERISSATFIEKTAEKMAEEISDADISAASEHLPQTFGLWRKKAVKLRRTRENQTQLLDAHGKDIAPEKLKEQCITHSSIKYHNDIIILTRGTLFCVHKNIENKTHGITRLKIGYKIKNRKMVKDSPVFLKIITRTKSAHEKTKAQSDAEMQAARHFEGTDYNATTERPYKEYMKSISVTKYSGMTLVDALNVYQFTPLQLMDLAVQLLQMIVAINKAGYVHRDIKLDNSTIMPDPDNVGYYKLYVIDYGYAHKLKHGVLKGNLCGTLGYLTPYLEDVHNGKKGTVCLYGFFTDLYAGAISCREMLRKVATVQLSRAEKTVFDDLNQFVSEILSNQVFKNDMPQLNQTQIESSIADFSHRVQDIKKTQPVPQRSTETLEINNIVAKLKKELKEKQAQKTQLIAQFSQKNRGKKSDTSSDDSPVSPEVVTIKNAISIFVKEYENYSKRCCCCSLFNKKHGYLGLKRAKDLMEEIHKSTDLDAIKKALSLCFGSYFRENAGLNKHSLISYILSNQTLVSELKLEKATGSFNEETTDFFLTTSSKELTEVRKRAKFFLKAECDQDLAETLHTRKSSSI
jgi:serine/threonine protein kinase